MSRQNIPLQRGASNAHQRLSVQLGTRFLELRIDWNTRFEYWSVDIFEGNQPIARGLVLNPPSDILNGLNLTRDYGRLIFTGEQATLDNLGASNALVWQAS